MTLWSELCLLQLRRHDPGGHAVLNDTLWVPPDKPSYLQYLGFSCTTSFFSQVEHKRLCGHLFLVWVLTPLWAVWFLVLIWTSLNLSVEWRSWPVLSFLPTSVLAPPTSLGWGAPTFTVFAEQPMGPQSWGFEQLLSPAQDNHLPEFKKQPCNSITDRSQGRSCVLSTSVMPAPCDLRDCGSSAPLSMGFPRKEHWSGLPFLPLGELPDPGIEPESSALAGAFFTTVSPGKQRSSLDSNYI